MLDLHSEHDVFSSSGQRPYDPECTSRLGSVERTWVVSFGCLAVEFRMHFFELGVWDRERLISMIEEGIENNEFGPRFI